MEKQTVSTDVTGASFSGADLRGADLSGVVGLTIEQLHGATIDETTKLPAGISMVGDSK